VSEVLGKWEDSSTVHSFIKLITNHYSHRNILLDLLIQVLQYKRKLLFSEYVSLSFLPQYRKYYRFFTS